MIAMFLTSSSLMLLGDAFYYLVAHSSYCAHDCAKCIFLIFESESV